MFSSLDNAQYDEAGACLIFERGSYAAWDHFTGELAKRVM